MTKPKEITAEELAKLLLNFDSIIADNGLAEDIATAITTKYRVSERER